MQEAGAHVAVNQDPSGAPFAGDVQHRRPFRHDVVNLERGIDAGMPAADWED